MDGARLVQRQSRALQSARSLLLTNYSALEHLATSQWLPALQREAAPHTLPVHWRGLLADEPTVSAVRVAHLLETGQPGLHAWHACWPAAAESAPLKFAAAAAGLLAGREYLQILAAAVDGADDDCGALIDGESCARMAVAGFDPDTELRLGNCLELLASAGDLLNRPARATTGVEPIRYLILGLNWHAPAGD